MPNDPKLSDEPQWMAQRVKHHTPVGPRIYIRHPLWYDAAHAAASYFGTTMERVKVTPMKRAIESLVKPFRVIRWQDGGVRQEIAIESQCIVAMQRRRGFAMIDPESTRVSTNEITKRDVGAMMRPMKTHRMCASCFRAVRDARDHADVADIVSKTRFIKRPVGPPVTKRVARPRARAKAKPAARKRR